jgi:hypothetical protein
MLIILTLYYLASQAVQALPIPANNQLDSPSCYNVRYCRTVWNIVWSCLVTIFACTWIAIHPNIPSLDERLFTIALRRLKIMVMALLAPELVIMWSIRQWLVAHRLAKKYQSAFVAVTDTQANP